MTFRETVQLRGCPLLGLPRLPAPHHQKLRYTRTIFQSAAYCSARPQRGPEVGGTSQSWSITAAHFHCEPSLWCCNRQQKWCLRGVLSGTSRGESGNGRTQLARIKNWAKNARGGSISWSRWHRKSLAIPPRCASPAANEALLKLYATCAMATAQPLVAQRRNGPCTHGLETFRARRPLTLGTRNEPETRDAPRTGP